jgi:hypothetical protein
MDIVACINHVSGPTVSLSESIACAVDAHDFTMEEKEKETKSSAYLFQDAPFHLCSWWRINKHLEEFNEVICIQKHLGASTIVHVLLLEEQTSHACAVTALKQAPIIRSSTPIYPLPRRTYETDDACVYIASVELEANVSPLVYGNRTLVAGLPHLNFPTMYVVQSLPPSGRPCHQLTRSNCKSKAANLCCKGQSRGHEPASKRKLILSPKPCTVP